MMYIHNKLFIGSLLLAVAAVGLYAGMYMSIQRAQDALLVLRTETGANELLEHSIRSMHALVNDTHAERLELASYFVSHDNPAQFLGDIETLGADAGVLLDTVSLEEQRVIPRGGLPEARSIVLTLEVEGTWANMYRFLKMVENASYAVRVRAFSFDRESSSDSVWNGRVQVGALTQ